MLYLIGCCWYINSFCLARQKQSMRIQHKDSLVMVNETVCSSLAIFLHWCSVWPRAHKLHLHQFDERIDPKCISCKVLCTFIGKKGHTSTICKSRESLLINTVRVRDSQSSEHPPMWMSVNSFEGNHHSFSAAHSSGICAASSFGIHETD